ncbi:MAG: ABC transporter ATP-binding protein [bacterium]|nr:MAG: ABC transporter ATP-binding protein [bacterium]
MVSLKGVTKRYHTRHCDINALDNINLAINEGEFVVIRGPSGSGKTTLLLSIGGMLRPTKGQIIADRSDIYAMNKRNRANFRAENIGFVFQMFHLVPYLNVMENVLLPISEGTRPGDKDKAKQLLERFNLLEREFHRPSELSAGEKQRTAIARALLNQPKIILADEPTGNLDPENSQQIIGYLSEFHHDGGTVIAVTHGVIVDQFADRIFYMNRGTIGE